jgi:hypothetical protein
MSTVIIEPELYKRVVQAAQETDSTPEIIMSEATKRYLWELHRRKISEESQLYQKLHTQLQSKYLNQFIAMLNGQVVDHDRDFQALHHRVRQNYQHQAVMITLVQETAEITLVRRGFRYENNLP